jgi:hypothetical protein
MLLVLAIAPALRIVLFGLSVEDLLQLRCFKRHGQPTKPFPDCASKGTIAVASAYKPFSRKGFKWVRDSLPRCRFV